MKFKNFQELAGFVKISQEKTKVAVVMAQDSHTLEAVVQAVREKIIEAILIGDTARIVTMLRSMGESEKEYEIVEAQDGKESMKIAAHLVNEGQAGAIMKGKMETGQIMRGILDKENNLKKGGLISLVGFYESPYYDKMFAVTDQAINISPDLDAKRKILENAVEALHLMGNQEPKVACLCAVEKVNPKMPETVDANDLKELNQKGEIKGCIVDGPISLDLAMVRESAKIKGYQGEIAGDADLLLVPNLVSGNLLVKAITEVGGGKTGGIVLGAKVPVILVSRAASAQDKFNSIALAAYMGRKNI